MGVEFVPLLDQAVFAAYRRQQELVWTEHQIEHIEQAVGSAGITRPLDFKPVTPSPRKVQIRWELLPLSVLRNRARRLRVKHRFSRGGFTFHLEDDFLAGGGCAGDRDGIFLLRRHDPEHLDPVPELGARGI